MDRVINTAGDKSDYGIVNDNLDFDEIYTFFWPKIYRYAIRLVGSQEAEDLTQEIFIKVNQALKTFRNESKLSTWIYRVATNAAIDRKRSSSFQRKVYMDQASGSLMRIRKIGNMGKNIGLGKKSSLIEEQIIHKEMNECIRGYIDSLPDNYRTIFVLSEMEGLKNKEIADILELSLEVVKARLHRGKIKMRKKLVENCTFYWDTYNELACDPKCPKEK